MLDKHFVIGSKQRTEDALQGEKYTLPFSAEAAPENLNSPNPDKSSRSTDVVVGVSVRGEGVGVFAGEDDWSSVDAESVPRNSPKAASGGA